MPRKARPGETIGDLSHGCPYCGDVHECATAITARAAVPVDGDVSFCISCGAFSIFDSSAPGGTRKAIGSEMTDITTDFRLAEVRRAWEITKQKFSA